MPSQDLSLLQAALIGYREKRTEIERAIAEIRFELRAQAPEAMHRPRPTSKPKVRSAAARRRMSTAQKKRWNAYRKQQAA